VRKTTYVIQGCLQLVCLFGVGMGALLVLRVSSHYHLKPPDGILDPRYFATRMPAAQQVYLARKGTEEYIVWIGESGRPPIPSSGPACYMFDRMGKLVDWCDETNEGDPVDEFYHQRAYAQKMTLDEALALVEQRQKQSPGNTASPQYR